MKKIMLIAAISIALLCASVPVTSHQADATPRDQPGQTEGPGGGTIGPDGSFTPPKNAGTKVCRSILSSIENILRNQKNSSWGGMNFLYYLQLDSELGMYDTAGCNNQPGMPQLPPHL